MESSRLCSSEATSNDFMKGRGSLKGSEHTPGKTGMVFRGGGVASRGVVGREDMPTVEGRAWDGEGGDIASRHPGIPLTFEHRFIAWEV